MKVKRKQQKGGQGLQTKEESKDNQHIEDWDGTLEERVLIAVYFFFQFFFSPFPPLFLKTPEVQIPSSTCCLFVFDPFIFSCSLFLLESISKRIVKS